MKREFGHATPKNLGATKPSKSTVWRPLGELSETYGMAASDTLYLAGSVPSRILYEKAFTLRLSGNEVSNTNLSILLVKNMLCSKHHCQRGFNLILFSYKMCTQVRPWRSRMQRLPSPRKGLSRATSELGELGSKFATKALREILTHNQVEMSLS